jgi:molybdopterin-dependent oxidoreductase alpha subunit
MIRRVRWTPRNWASRVPFGIGEQRPNNYAEVFRAAWKARRRPLYSWRILRDGCCDGCALGTTGVRDWTLDGIHLCNVRLRLLELNTLRPMADSALMDAEALAGRSAARLRMLGRLPWPALRRRGERGFSRISWDEALELVNARIQSTSPDRVAAYLTSRGTTNETYYVAQKAMRKLGVASIDNAARVCHSPSTFGLKQALGVGASTCSYSDWIGTDLIVFIGSNPANNQPVAMKYLHYAKKEGTRVVSVNPYREPGMERYWIPSAPESALFGTKITDRWFELDVGGDVAFFTGVLKAIQELGLADERFIAAHTSGYAPVAVPWDVLERGAGKRGAGTPRAEMEAFAREVGAARTAVFVWSMGATQHTWGEDNVRAIVNVALTRGFVGREHCGLMPIRGHSGVQGGAEMGCYADALPGGDRLTPENAARWSERWGFTVPEGPGRKAPEMIDAAHRGELDVLLAVGGSFTEVLPDPRFVRAALTRIPLRVHMDLVLNPQMLLEGDEVLLLPAQTRYENAGGVTETSTERRIIYSPEIEGRKHPEARPEWEVFAALAGLDLDSTAAIRAEIGRLVPLYAGIERLRAKGDEHQYGGRRLCEGWTFGTDDGKAHFSEVQLPPVPDDPTRLRLTTRRGKQFNSMVQERKDALTGATREAVLINAADAATRGLADGAEVVVRNACGELRGRALFAPVKSGNVQVHWPEGNVLLDPEQRSAEAGIPDYNAWVDVEPVA